MQMQTSFFIQRAYVANGWWRTFDEHPEEGGEVEVSEHHVRHTHRHTRVKKVMLKIENNNIEVSERHVRHTHRHTRVKKVMLKI
jgi:hypothetical protein